MTVFDSITPITVSGQYVAPDGTARSGSVTFTPSVSKVTAGFIVTLSPLRVELDEYGAFSVVLLATDDPQWQNGGFSYTVTENIRGVDKRSYTIQVPSNSPGGELDLALLIPALGSDALTASDVEDYIGESSWDAGEVARALDTETAAQARICRVPIPMPDDLREALLRRVRVNLEMRRRSDSVEEGDAGLRFIPRNDPMVRRLEAPHRRVVTG